MKSDLNLLQTDDAVDVTSRHVVDNHDAAFGTSHHALGRYSVSTSLVRVDVVDVADTSSRHEHLPEINRLD